MSERTASAGGSYIVTESGDVIESPEWVAEKSQGNVATESPVIESSKLEGDDENALEN